MLRRRRLRPGLRPRPQLQPRFTRLTPYGFEIWLLSRCGGTLRRPLQSCLDANAIALADALGDFTAHTAVGMRVDVALANSFGFGGTNASLVFGRV